MKVAIVHDISLVFGGAERVLISLLSMYPHADVYISFISPSYKKILNHLTDGRIMVSPWNRWVHTERSAKYFKPLVMLWWGRLDLSGYDVVISSSHSYSSKSAHPPRGVSFVAYIHTPPRYLWGIYNETRWIHNTFFRIVLSPVVRWLQIQDLQSATRPDVLIANSEVTKKRIKSIYKRESVVVYPPVKIPKLLPKRHPSYYLCVSRLVKQKRVDVIVRACNELGLPLVIVGIGDEEAYLKSIAGPTVRFLGFIPDEQMNSIYRSAKGLIHVPIEEDFGLVPVEAMAHGVPVIASADGGVSESVVHNKTGLLLKSVTAYSLMRAMERFEKMKFLSETCRKQAQKFSEENFHKSMLSIVSRLTNIA